MLKRLVHMMLLFFTTMSVAAPKNLLEIPKVSRDKVICFALYTVNDNVLKMTAQLYPLKDGEQKTVRLEVRDKSKWKQIAKAEVVVDGWTSHFRVENWDCSKKTEYRLAHGDKCYYSGVIQKDPVDKDVITLAAFTGNSIYPRDGGEISKADIVENISKVKPDLLFFSGDQVYDHKRHYAYWLKFGRDFGEIIRNIPTITIPDDHDVGQGNLWGAEGKKSHKPSGDDGGYFNSASYVKQVERAQTSHLPDPYDPTLIKQGIGVYYTDLTWGRISFAIIEDRKFKSGPAGMVDHKGPRPDHIDYPDYDPKELDVPQAKLLGQRQLDFLQDWAGDWKGSDMKAVLSQTIFCGGAHLFWEPTRRIYADFDSNGWPQTGRNKALSEMRKAFAVHIAGDQHLATIFHHGIDEWEDACYSFCVPSIANLYMRWWDPLTPGENRTEGMPGYMGRHKDGFGNKVTCWGAANPERKANGDKLTTKAAGFGLVKFNKRDRTIKFECWPRNTDVTGPQSAQYSDWPKTISQLDNYNRKAQFYLPLLKIEGDPNPVVQVVDEKNNEMVYTLRLNGNRFRPKVFREGVYSIKVGPDEFVKTIRGVNSVSPEVKKELVIKY